MVEAVDRFAAGDALDAILIEHENAYLGREGKSI